MFKLFDSNNDGVISVEELRGVFSQKSQSSSLAINNFVHEIMTEIDKDKDNLISYEEFNEGLTSVLKMTLRD